MTFRGWALLSMLVSVAACTSKSGGSDSETHFVCSIDDECRAKFGEGYGCVEHSCGKVVRLSGFACDAGTTIPCAGPGNCTGTRVCGAPGQCVCDTPPADAAIEASADASVGVLPPLNPGLNWDSGGCTRQRYAVELIAQNLYVTLDQSLFMADVVPGSSSTWWQGAVAGIQAFSTSPIAEPARIAVQYFPLASPDSCTAAYDQPDVDFTDAFTSAAAIAASLSAHSPVSGLPSQGPALIGAIDHTKAITQPTQLAKVVLITKSAPSQCEPRNPADLAALAASGFAGSPSVATYVIGLDMSPLVYGPVATAGGTKQVLSIMGGDVQQQVRDAFDVVMGFDGTTGCELQFRGPGNGGGFDPSLLELSYEVGDGGSSVVTRVAGPSECAGLTRDGWYVDNPSAPTKVVLCPDLCAHPPSFNRDIVYGCR